MGYLDYAGLQYLWGKLKEKFAPKSHTHTKTEVGLGNVDNTSDASKSVKYAISAGNANTAATADSATTATTSKSLQHLSPDRPTSMNFNLAGTDYRGKVTYQIASTATTTGKPPNDTCVLNFGWDNGGWGAQVAVEGDSSPRMYVRGATNNNGASKWDASWKTIAYTSDKPATAGTADVANSAKALSTTVTLTGGDGNTTGYRLVAQCGIGKWTNNRSMFFVKSRHQGSGFIVVTIGNNTGTVNQANAYAEIIYYGPQNSGSVISDTAWQVYVSADGKTGYLFWKYNDYSECNVQVINSAFTLSNGAWMTSIGSGYGACKAKTSINPSYTTQRVIDSGNGTWTSLAYSKSGMRYGDYTWLAGWNNYELRAVNKNQFATAGHDHDLNKMINAQLSEGTSDPQDNDYYISQYSGGGTTTTTYHRRPIKALWNYIKGKTDAAYLKLTGGTISGQITKSTGSSWIGDRDNAAIKSRYAGDGAYGSVAAMATKNGYWTIGNLGGEERLVFNYSTDTNYNAGKNETSQVYLPAQAGTIITSATIGSQSVNYANSAGAVAWGNVSGKPSSYPPSSHTHDDRYYTESEMNRKLNEKLSLGGGTMTGPIKFNSSSLPRRASHDFIVGIDAFDAGGTLKWAASSDVKVGSATTADKANSLSGLFSRSSQSWGVQTGTFVHGENDSTGGSFAFRRDCPIGGQMSMVIDGRFYQNEGQYRVLDTSDEKNLNVQSANFAKETYISQYKTVNLTDLDQNTWYPVTGTGILGRSLRHFKCNVQLNSGSKPNWSTHGSGFTAVVDILEEPSDWGTTRMLGEVLINDQLFIADESKPPVGYQQMDHGSIPVWWLRGGGTYFLAADYDCTWTIRKSKYEDRGQSVAPTITYPGVNVSRATITANLNGNANTAGVATTAVKLARSGDTSYPMTFNWSGQGGQPTWLWGGNDGTNMYVWNPSNFSVNYANSAGNGVETSGADYIRFSNGLQICWGDESSGSSSGVNVFFPVPFSATPPYIGFGSIIATQFTPYLKSRSNTFFTWYKEGTTFGKVCWVAIGKWK